MEFSKTSDSQTLKSPPQSNPKFVPQLLQNPLTSDQIEKCLDENKKLILAIMNSISLGKFTESVQYQEMLQHNLTYLTDIANAQQGSSTSSQAVTSFVQQGNPMQQTQASTAKMQQESDHVPNLSFLLNTPQSQDQPLPQFLHLQHQQQFQSQLGFSSTTNSGMHQTMRPGLSNSSGMNIEESMQVGSSNGRKKRKSYGGKN